jgi:hypothetical protein
MTINESVLQADLVRGDRAGNLVNCHLNSLPVRHSSPVGINLLLPIGRDLPTLVTARVVGIRCESGAGK